MGLFDLFTRKKSREPDKIWMHREGKTRGLCEDIQACLVRRETVLVVTFLQDGVNELAARMEGLGVPARKLPAESLPSPVELWGAPEALLCRWPSAPRLFYKAALGPSPVSDPKTLWILAADHHALVEHDQNILDFAAALPGPTKVRFYGALDDPLLKAVGADRLMALMGSLGMKENQAIESPLVTRQIIKAQAKAAEALRRDGRI